MTATRKFKATFKDLATASGVSYREMKQGTLVSEPLGCSQGTLEAFIISSRPYTFRKMT